ncbi:hypothetical protein ACNKU7_08740 [Microbulbifer sp. SA54]|uniref:hypothetical protein n=1 Tax=Microbulbifer sp. SA54 TaxID=3401577 RepID=UPI003AAE4225
MEQEKETDFNQDHTFSGVFVLHIWSEDRDKFITLYRGGVTLGFQPLVGMKIVSSTNNFTIHDIAWDIEENTFRAHIVQIEHDALDSFIDIEYLVKEAERIGWKRSKGVFGEIQEAENSEFNEYCFPLREKLTQTIESEDRDERFKKVVLDSLTELGQKLASMDSLQPVTLIIGVVIGAVISAVMQAVIYRLKSSTLK